jgi:hypothetical protein
MKYPLALLLPVFLLIDFFAGTVVARVADQAYGHRYSHMAHHVKAGDTGWRFSYRWPRAEQVFVRLLVSGLFIALMESGFYSGDTPRVHLGIALGASSLWATRHLDAWFYARYLARNPDELAGHLAMSRPLSVIGNAYRFTPVTVPLVLAAIVTADPFIWGFAIGATALVIVLLIYAGDLKEEQLQTLDMSDPKLQRQSMQNGTRPWCELLELPEAPRDNDPQPGVVAGQDATELTFQTMSGSTLTVTFSGSQAATLAPPTVGTIASHRLWGSGIEPNQAHVVHNSAWIATAFQQDRYQPGHDPQAWTDLTHYVFTFEGATFECIAESHTVDLATPDVSVEDVEEESDSTATN